MSALLFYHNKKNKELLSVERIPNLFTDLYSNNFNTQLFCIDKKEGIYHLHKNNIEFFLIGDFTFYNDFVPNIELLIQNNKINQEELNRTFRKINGIYCCIIFDNSSNQVYIITDYLGFYPLYFYQDENLILFSTEIKYFLFFEKINCTIDDEAIFSYLYNGHLMLNQSWFQQVKRTRPASIYTLNLQSHIMHQEYFWVWSRENKILTQKKEINETFAAFFTKGIEDLDIASASKIGVSLSGGLESRWIAQIASNKFPLEAFTFSTSNNYETQLAEQVANALNIKHQQIRIKKDNWLLNRLDAFWKIDGMMHLGHLHEADIHTETHATFTHCFHGFYGGGIYTNAKGCVSKLTNEIVKKRFKFKNSEPGIDDPFYQTGCLNPYTGDNKIRYQSAYSMYLLSTYCKMILPFYNMDWLEFNFNYSVDDAFEGYSTLYLEVLNASLDEKLLNIPWQRTGLPPKYIGLNILFMKFKLPSIIEAAFQKFNSSRHFINYNFFDSEIDFWIREFRSDISNLQLNYTLNSREQKLRMLSLVVWLRMISKNSPDVL